MFLPVPDQRWSFLNQVSFSCFILFTFFFRGHAFDHTLLLFNIERFLYDRVCSLICFLVTFKLRKLLAVLFCYLLQEFGFFAPNENQIVTRIESTCRPSGPMNLVIIRQWFFEVDYQTDIFDVHSPCTYICTHELLIVQQVVFWTIFSYNFESCSYVLDAFESLALFHL